MTHLTNYEWWTKNDYAKKIQEINKEIQEGVYAKTEEYLTRHQAVSGLLV